MLMAYKYTHIFLDEKTLYVVFELHKLLPIVKSGELRASISQVVTQHLPPSPLGSFSAQSGLVIVRMWGH